MINRRTFLKIGGTLAASAIGVRCGGQNVPGTGLNGAPAPGSGKGPHREKQVPTFCEVCFWKCGMIATVADGLVTKLEGNPAHPLSNGRLCPRGVSATGILYDENRLKKPLIRKKNDAGEDYFQEVSWGEALDFTARKLEKIIQTHGPESIALFSHGHGGTFFKTLMKAMGSKTITAPSYAQCRGPRETAFALTYGRGVGSPEIIDMPHSKCVVLLGSHLGENMHNTAVQDLSKAIERGARFITVDPRFSTMAGKSDHWLPIKPGTDLALLLAWMHVIIAENLYQKDFVKNNTTGFPELKKHVSSNTPEWAYIQTGIEPDLIRDTARMMARYAPASFVHPGRRVVWYGDDTQRIRAVAILNALLGNWAKKGGFYLPARFALVSEDYPRPTEAKAFRLRGNNFPVGSGIPSQAIVNSSIKRSDVKNQKTVRSWIAYGCNIPLSMPDPVAVKQALESLDFLLAIDILPTEITGYADVVLPECTFLERFGEYDARENRLPYVALRRPVIAPLYDSKPGYWIARELAKRIKVKGKSLERFFPHRTLRDKLKAKAKASNFSFDTIMNTGVITKKHPDLYDMSPRMKFGTPSGKIEIFSRALQDAGLDPLPRYTPPEEPPEGYFRLLFGRHPVHTFSRTTNNKLSLELFSENELWLNLDMARVLDIKDGAYVVLENQDGMKSNPIKVKVTQRIRQDCVYMVHGFGHEDPRLKRAYRRGASDSGLITRYKEDPVMGGTGMNVNFVSLEKVDAFQARRLREVQS